MGNRTSQEAGSAPNPNSNGASGADGAETNSTAGGNTNNGVGSYYTMLKSSYQSLVRAIIRPPRARYTFHELGPDRFVFCGRHIQRRDFELVNARGMRIQCSQWEPTAQDRPTPILPCVVYMHGNSSCRLEALSCLSLVLTLGASLMAFDFTGSGLSDGEYVTLGTDEKEDVAVVVSYLRDCGRTSTIALWGRSMGAATALLHGERDPSIAAMILDSAFSDLVVLAEEMVDKGRAQGLYAPTILVRLALKFIRSSVQRTAGFDIKTLSPIEHAGRCFIPALFVAGADDSFVAPEHSRRIYDVYGGEKRLEIVEGNHNTRRPEQLYLLAASFLSSTLQIQNDWILPDGYSYCRTVPWAYRASHHQMPHHLVSAAHQAGTLPMEANLTVSSEGELPNFDAESMEELDLALEEVLALSLLEAEQASSSVLNRDVELAMQQDVEASIAGFFGSGGKTNTRVSSKVDAKGDSGDKSSNSDITASSTVYSPQIAESKDTTPISRSSSQKYDTNHKISSCDFPNHTEPMRSVIFSPPATPKNIQQLETEWMCATCTLLNRMESEVCEACGMNNATDK